MRTIGTKTSTCANVNDDASGRKAKTGDTVVAREGAEVGRVEKLDSAVLVNVIHDDAVVFLDELESVPSLDEETSDDDEDDEESVGSDEDEEGKILNGDSFFGQILVINFDTLFATSLLTHSFR